MDLSELCVFIEENYYAKTAEKTMGRLLWELHVKDRSNSLFIKCVTSEQNFLASLDTTVFYGTNGKIVKKMGYDRKSIILSKENDIVILQHEWRSIDVFIFYNNRKLPPL